jgi:hypothetical protein
MDIIDRWKPPDIIAGTAIPESPRSPRRPRKETGCSNLLRIPGKFIKAQYHR